jgi:hypothetical protein
MGTQVVMGAMLQCTFGVAPSSLVVLPQNKVMAMVPAANILDNKPIANIPPFGMCMSPSNPTVASATAAAMGVLTPMPCVPATAAPWMPGNVKVTIGQMPALDSNCKLMCNWGGVIQIVSPGQVKVNDA